jgi:hypothetical protein
LIATLLALVNAQNLLQASARLHTAMTFTARSRFHVILDWTWLLEQP